jgi:hypothetical protein
VQKYSLYFTEILIIDGAGVDELNGAIGGSFVINVIGRLQTCLGWRICIR